MDFEPNSRLEVRGFLVDNSFRVTELFSLVKKKQTPIRKDRKEANASQH